MNSMILLHRSDMDMVEDALNNFKNYEPIEKQRIEKRMFSSDVVVKYYNAPIWHLQKKDIIRNLETIIIALDQGKAIRISVPTFADLKDAASNLLHNGDFYSLADM